jgi:hypothetical protein
MPRRRCAASARRSRAGWRWRPRRSSCSGEDVTFRFFDSRLYECHAARNGQIPVAYLLSFRGERGRNPTRVFTELARTLELSMLKDPRDPVLHLFTHAGLYIPQETMAEVTRRAKVAAVFMLPSGGELHLTI